MMRVLMQVVTIDHVPLVKGLFCQDTYVGSMVLVQMCVMKYKAVMCNSGSVMFTHRVRV